MTKYTWSRLDYSWSADGRPMCGEEIAAVEGTREVWSITHHNGDVTEFAAVLTRHGWVGEDHLLCQKDDPTYTPPTSETSLLAIQSNLRSLCRRGSSVEGIRGPNGSEDFLAIRFSSPGRTPTVCPFVVVADEVWHKAAPHLRHRAYGQFDYNTFGAGVLRHVGNEEASEAFEDKMASAALRADLAILRYFGMHFPLSRVLWVMAAVETEFTVEVSVNHGPWRVVDGKGKLLEESVWHSDT